jgi:hypothetical protein
MELCGYGIHDIIGRNCSFLLEHVPADCVDFATRERARAFCDPARNDFSVFEDESQKDWLPHGHRPGPDGIFCAQANARKDRTLFSSMFYLKHVMLDDKMLIVGLQTELPSLPKDMAKMSAESKDVFRAACLCLHENMGEVERILARMFWFSAEMRRQETRNRDMEAGQRSSENGYVDLPTATISTKSNGSCSPVSCTCPQRRGKMETIGEADFQKNVRSLAEEVKLWEEGYFSCIRTLQPAPRNHGQVDLMEFIAPEGGHQFAVKKIPVKWMRRSAQDFAERYPGASEQPWNDIAFLKALNSMSAPHVCQFWDVFGDKKWNYLVMELCEEGDLFDWSERTRVEGKERESQMRPLAKQMCSGVMCIHTVGIAHRDLSLENILLKRAADGQLQVKIIDFGTATLKRFHKNEVRGKQSYQAPEMHVDGAVYDAFLTDVFMLGVVFFSMLIRDYPWMSTKPGCCKLFEFCRAHGLLTLIRRRKLRLDRKRYIADLMTQGIAELLEVMLQLKPDARSTLAEPCWKDVDAYGTAQRRSVWDMHWLQEPDPPQAGSKQHVNKRNMVSRREMLPWRGA